MGMFDYIRVETPLPRKHDVILADAMFQTKDLDCMMDVYVITSTGELYRERWDYTWVESDDGLLGGYLREIPDSFRREYLDNYHGNIHFYTSINWDGDTHTRIDYVATFTNGKLSRMRLQDTPR
jgi:hypothetical protein